MNAEGITAGDEVLLPIAQKADGGMRDGLSLLDQVLSFTEGTPTPDDVRRILGLVGTEVYLELFGILADRRQADVFRFVGRMLDEGYDLTEFYRGLADFIRALLIARLGGGDPESVPAHLQVSVAEMAGRFSGGDLLRMLAQVAELDADGRFRKSGEQRILIELLLLRFAYLESTVSIEDVLSALGMGGGGADGGSRGNGGGGGNRPSSDAPAPRAFDRPAASATASPPAPRLAPEPAPTPRAAVSAPVAEPTAAIESPAPETPVTPAAASDASADATAAAEPVSADAAAVDPSADVALAATDARTPTSETAAPAETYGSATLFEAAGETAPAAPGPQADVPAAPAVTEPAPRTESANAAPAPVEAPRRVGPAPPPDVDDAPATGYSTGSYDEYDFPPLELPNEAPSSPAPHREVTAMAISPATADEPRAAPASASSDAGPIDRARLRQAWTHMLSTPGKLPAGMRMLQAGTVEAAGGREIRITLPAGNLAAEKLANPAVLRAVEDAFAEALHGPVRISITTGAVAAVDPKERRITAESARRDRLNRLMEGEPLLQAAVKAWDLELAE
jgi:DNA polymerase-3 subunit gamma/tau